MITKTNLKYIYLWAWFLYIVPKDTGWWTDRQTHKQPTGLYIIPTLSNCCSGIKTTGEFGYVVYALCMHWSCIPCLVLIKVIWIKVICIHQGHMHINVINIKVMYIKVPRSYISRLRISRSHGHNYQGHVHQGHIYQGRVYLLHLSSYLLYVVYHVSILKDSWSVRPEES